MLWLEVRKQQCVERENFRRDKILILDSDKISVTTHYRQVLNLTDRILAEHKISKALIQFLLKNIKILCTSLSLWLDEGLTNEMLIWKSSIELWFLEIRLEDKLLLHPKQVFDILVLSVLSYCRTLQGLIFFKQVTSTILWTLGVAAVLMTWDTNR